MFATCQTAVCFLALASENTVGLADACKTTLSGGSRGGARGACPPYFGFKKNRRRRKSRQGRKHPASTPPFLAQGLDPPLTPTRFRMKTYK